MEHREVDLSPSFSCFEDAELLDCLWLGKVYRQFANSPVEDERLHSKSVFEDLVSKHDRCHEACFGLGRIYVLERQYDAALPHLENAVAIARDATYLAWLAWALLLSSPSVSLMKRAAHLARAAQSCKEALEIALETVLALRCLVHVAQLRPLSADGGWPAAMSHAMRLATVRPVAGFLPLGTLLLQEEGHFVQASNLLRECIAEVPLDGQGAEKVAGAAVSRLLASDGMSMAATMEPRPPQQQQLIQSMVQEVPPPGTSPGCTPDRGQLVASAKPGRAWDPRIVSVKLSALDRLWKYFVHVHKQPELASEVSLLAIAALRPCPRAWQRAVSLALKALAFQGQWRECWQLAAAELAFMPSREIIYQCGRLAFFDGRWDAIDAYSPHLRALLPLVPPSARAVVQFWVGMLYHKRNYGLLAAPLLRASLPGLQSAADSSKLQRAEKALRDIASVEATLTDIYKYSNAVWAKRRNKPKRPGLARTTATAKAADPAAVERQASDAAPGGQVQWTDSDNDFNTLRTVAGKTTWIVGSRNKEVRDLVIAREGDRGGRYLVTGPFGLSRIVAPPPGKEQRKLVRCLVEVARSGGVVVTGGAAEPGSESDEAGGSSGSASDGSTDDDSRYHHGSVDAHTAPVVRNLHGDEISPAIQACVGARPSSSAPTPLALQKHRPKPAPALAQRGQPLVQPEHGGGKSEPMSWRIFGAWRGAKAANRVMAQDPYIARLCHGRIAVVNNDTAEAERIWKAVAHEYPLRIEPHIELWRLHSEQKANRMSVIDIQPAVELVSRRTSEWGNYTHIDVHLLLDGKDWPGVGTNFDVEHVVHVLLGKSLKRCRLWDDAWTSLCVGHDATADCGPIHAAFSYQLGKLATQYLQELLTAHVRAGQVAGSSDAGVGAGDALADLPTLQLWLTRGQGHMSEFLKHARNETDSRKGTFYRERLEQCAQAIEGLRAVP